MDFPIANPRESAAAPTITEESRDALSGTPSAESRNHRWNLGLQVFRRAVDLFAIGLLILVSLTAGLQISEWWRNDCPLVPPLPQDSNIPFRELPLTLQYGELPVAIERSPFRGNRAGVEKALVSMATTAVKAGKIPTEPCSQEESAWLLSLDRLIPTFSLGDQGDIYAGNHPLPSVVATRFLPAGESFVEARSATQPVVPWTDLIPLADAMRPENLSATNDGPNRRVVCWGLAFPEGADRWVLLMFHPRGSSPPGTDFDFRECFPTAAQRILQMNGIDGSSWSVWEMAGSSQSWFEEFSRKITTSKLAETMPRWITQKESAREEQMSGGRFLRDDEMSLEVRCYQKNSSQFTVLAVVTPARK